MADATTAQGSPVVEPEGKAEAKPEATRDKNSTATDDRAATIGGVVVWIVVVLGVLLYFFWPFGRSADVLLDVSPAQPFTVKGSVLFKGAPVHTGRVHLLVSDARDQRYLGSLAVPVENGTFTGSGSGLLPEGVGLDRPLRVSARFLGRGGDKEQKNVSGDAAVYLNFAPPLGPLMLWSTVGTLTVVALVLITLFTGELTRRKARSLFGMTYLMTFLSLALPIALTVLVSRNAYLVKMMEAAPIGLVKGTAKGVDTPQWILNIGGAVTPARPPQPKPAVEPKPPADGVPLVPAVPAAPVDERAARTLALAREEPLVVGGLAVPFYVVFLAMLGAGINMTIQVPKIQNRYDVLELPAPSKSILRTALEAPLKILADSKPDTPAQSEVKSGIRRELIGNYMYLLSAPFLAIAVYYFLQIVATNTAEPVLVLMAFATGLVSDRIILRITRFAEDTLGRDATEAAADATTKAQEAEAKAREAQATAKEAEAKAKKEADARREAEAAARVTA